MRLGRRLALVAGVAAIAIANTSFGQTGQRVTGPIATYWMSAQTTSGFGMPGMGTGGARPDPQAMMRAMMGGGGANKTLQLDLGSSNTAPAPSAEHLPPAALQAGPSLPLLTPKIAPAPAPERDVPDVPRDFQRPRGKMLIFWGCGERAKPGQPVVIDFAQMTTNPQAMAALMRGIDVRAMRPPAPGRNRTYGGWPNEQTRTQVQPASSLVGAHTVRGNYSPEIRFNLEADQDFLGALNLATNARAPAGHVNLGWNLVPNAQAYYATVVGGGRDETIVMWTSSEQQSVAFAMPDFIAQGDIPRLVQSKALMGPATRTCAVPKEVADAAQGGLVQLVAYGGEANFVYPPRPTDPKVAWNQQWAVKVRYRSSTGGLLGQPMPGMADADDAPPRPGARPGRPAQGQPAQPRPPSPADILRGTLGIPRF